MNVEQLVLIKQTLKAVRPAEGLMTPETVMNDIHKSLNAVNRELRLLTEPLMQIVDTFNVRAFTIIREKEYKGFLIVLAKFDDYKTYDGRMLLVFKGVKSSEELLTLTQGALYPDFNYGPNSPVAKFRPLKESVKLVEAMINALQEIK